MAPLPPVPPGLPGGPELVLITLVVLVVLYATLGRWVYRDANARGSEWAWQWAVGLPLTFVFGIEVGLLTIIIYLLVRDDRVERHARL